MKEKEIQEVYNLWLGNFILSTDAMCKIGEILKKKEVKDLEILNAQTGEALIKAEKALI